MADLLTELEALRKKPSEYHYICWGGSTVVAVDYWSSKSEVDCGRRGTNDWPSCKTCNGLHHTGTQLREHERNYNSAIDDALALIAAEKARGPGIAHTVGDNDLLYKQYGIRESEHTPETEQLCEVIRSLESRGPDPLLVQAREALGQIENHHNETEGWRDIARVALAALDAKLGGGK